MRRRRRARRASRGPRGSGDELLRRSDLRVPTIELAVQLPPQELVENGADARRLLEAEASEIVAGDLEADLPKVGEVALEARTRRLAGERIGEEGAVGIVRLDHRADGSRLLGLPQQPRKPR